MTSDLKLNLPPLKPVKFVGSQTLGLGTLPTVQYGLFSERIRRTASKDFHCSVFCSGKKCKFEGPSFWEREDMAIDGIFSHWITDDIVSMARPSTEIIEKYKVITQFHEHGIKSLINLQQPGEHGSCGDPLERSGFTYDPQVFMENKIFYYNFDWKDYGSMPKTTLLDMVKVLTFALTEGKVAIHSHAGVGRTGVLLACYLVYTLRCKPNDAVTYVRTKRPNSVQTKSQVESVQGFAQFVVPLFVVFSNVIPRQYGSSLNQYLRRQRHLLHGFEARLLKYIPKPVFMFCERLLALTDSHRLSTESGLHMSAMMDNPNRFLGFFSAGCRLDYRHRLSMDQWTLKLPPISRDAASHIRKQQEEEERKSAPPSPSESITGGTRAFTESPDSSSSPEESGHLGNRIGCAFRNDDDILDFPLSEDEELGITPELEYSSHSQKSSSSHNNNNVNINNNSKNDKENVVNENEDEDEAADEDEIEHREIDDIIEEVTEDKVEEDEDLVKSGKMYKDPMDDINSEECNAIIDSVLQDSPLDEDIVRRRVIRRRDVFASKQTKGCSSVGADYEGQRTFSCKDIADVLLADHYTLDAKFASTLKKYQRELNNKSSTWEKVSKETDPLLLAALLWGWMDQLKEPVLNKNDLSCIVIRAEKPLEILQKLDNGTRYTTEYMVRFIAQLNPKTPKLREDLLRRLVASLTHQKLGIKGTLRPVGMEWTKMRQGTTAEVMIFVNRLYELVIGEPVKTIPF